MPPSGTPVKELILQDIETTLAAITAGSAYYTSDSRLPSHRPHPFGD